MWKLCCKFRSSIALYLKDNHMKHIKAGARGLPTIEGLVFQLQSKFEVVTILGRHGGACSRFLLEFAS